MHHPFAILEEWVKQGRIRVSDRLVDEEEEVDSGPAAAGFPDEPLGEEPEGESEAELFEAAMQDVRPLMQKQIRARAPDPVAIRSSNDEDEDLKSLQEFCRNGRVEAEHTREYVEHAAHPVGRLYLNDLRQGRFAIQAHLDLHGLTVDQARPVVEAFLEASVRARYGCVRVVHGRGLHSVGKQPLMKKNVERWLSHRRLARYVVAYTSARAVDGGGGAVYVLLRSR